VNPLELETLGDVRVAVTALLGRATASIADVLKFAPGTVVPLDVRADAPVPLLVNGVAIASGDLVATDDGSLAIEIDEIALPDSRGSTR
jgi:flagellar motor switch protein FliN/FliY